MGLSGMKIQLCSSGVKAGCGASSSTSSGGGVIVAVVPSSVILSSTSMRRAVVPLKSEADGSRKLNVRWFALSRRIFASLK